MRPFAWISLALAALITSPALALDASGLPPRVGGPTTLDKLTLVRPDSSGPIGGMCATSPGSFICRTLAERAKEQNSVKDYGAVLDGSTDDTAAFDRARKAVTSAGQRITIPAGQRVTYADPGGALPAWWDIAGGFTFGGVVPSTRVGDDLTSSILEGKTRLWSRNNSTPNGAPIFRVDRDDVYNASNIDGTNTAKQTNCTAKGRTDHIYCDVTVMHIATSGGVDHYAKAIIAERRADSPANASSPAALYTELKDSTNQPDSASNGNSGMAMAEMDFYTNGTDLNNYRTLIALRIGSYASDFLAQTTTGSTTIRGFSGLNTGMLPGNTLSGSCIPGGTSVVSYNHAAQTAVLSQAAISTGQCSLNLDIVTGEVGNGLDLSASKRGGKVGQGFGVNMPFYGAGFDTSDGQSINNAPAFKMAAGQRIAFDGTGRGHAGSYSRSLRWDVGNLIYQGPNGPAFLSNDNGDFQVTGVLKAPAFNLPDQGAPSSTSDPAGAVGDVRFSGPNMYRKTTSGWLRFTGSTF